MSVLKISTWTPSRFAKWKECPAKVKYEDILKLCPVCKKGRLSGGFDGAPVTCDSCDQPQPERVPLERGNRLDAALTLHLSKTNLKTAPREDAAHSESLVEAIRHPEIEALAKKLRKAKGVSTQEYIVIDRNWKRLEEDPAKGKWAKGVWGRLKLDVLVIAKKIGRIIDWKSGNIDKSKGVIREKAEYHDSMRAYQLVVIATHPELESVTAEMAFLDAPPKLADPFKRLPVLTRKDFPEARAKWEEKIEAMMNDTVLGPRAGPYCNYCDFRKANGGPCKYG